MNYVIILVIAILASCKTPPLDLAFLTNFKMRNPNIILVDVKDLGLSDIGMHGGDINTPNIDYLISNGVLLARNYTTSNTHTGPKGSDL